MYIRELQVDGYGALQGVKLEFDAPVTVLYGLNEAGKSTLLRFIRSMLFGFPTRKDPVERGEPVFGGRHGGRLRLLDKSGREWLVERYAERGNGVSVREEGGIERFMAQAEWERLLLGGISERLFRQLFAVSLNELHELRSLQGEEIGNYLYHAGLAGGSALTAARRRISSEMDRLYRPKGTTQEMNRLLSAIKETETAIRHSRDSVAYYNETREALVQVENRLVVVEQRFPDLRMRAAKLQGAYELREWWLKREALLAEETRLREQLPDPTVPLLREESAISWSDLKERRAAAAGKLEEARGKTKDLRLLREKLIWDSELVAALPEWERLETQREAMVAKREERSMLETERRTLDETVQSTLLRLSADWGEAELLAFGGLAAEREQVRRQQQSWEEAERASISLQAEIRRISRQMEVLKAEESTVDGSAKSKNPSFVSSEGKGYGQAMPFGLFLPRTKSALLQAWHNVEDARRTYERARANIVPPSRSFSARSSANANSKSGSSKWLYTVAGLLCLTAASLPFMVGTEGPFSTVSYFISAIFLLVAAVTFVVAARRHSGTTPAVLDDSASASDYSASLRIHQRQVNERLRQLIDNHEIAAARLFSDSTDTTPTAFMQQTDNEDTVWQQLRTAVHGQLDRLEEIDRGNFKHQELQSRLQELQLEKELVERDSIKQQERLNELLTQWQQWLRTRKLPSHLAPDSLPELISMAGQGQIVLRQRQRVIERLATLNQSILEFEQAAIRLQDGCPASDNLRKDPFHAVQWQYREAVKQQAVKEEAEQLDRQIAVLAALVDEVAVEIAEIENGISALFTELRVSNEAELEQRLRIDERCLALRKEAREIGLRLESGRDQDAQAQLHELLASYDEATLSAMLSEQKILLAAEEQERSDLLDRRGRLTQELDRLRSEAELEDKGARLREMQSKLEQLSERYAILALSDQLIVQTKAVFEDEKQPEVLQKSSRYLQQMTNGAYIRILAPGDTPTLLAETHDRKLLDSSFLSRGTQEQLYLAMRFALCDAASPVHPLPLLLDDLFVHFDERRLTHTLPVLEDLAQTRQVLMFTCHRHAAQTIASGIPGARMLTLGG
ncbi:AAA family ATPase [Cohnella silvisoli]|uniref:AAA family ATPase n=1 Tax=Cohnella silvisoli TaxID=2873699 RepID=A0ABV1KP97_9BACL|nr:AAA family ATPase [Cohnella silvisoli]MCD9025605.1 AAA family ATPase [Cohnella silvisoli]